MCLVGGVCVCVRARRFVVFFFIELALFYQVNLNLRIIAQMDLGMKGMFTEILGSYSIKLQPLEACSIFLIFPFGINCNRHIRRHIWTTC